MPLTQPPEKPAEAAPAHTDLTVRVDLRRPDLAGELLIGERPAGTFSGWLGLLTALDRALDTLELPSADGGAR
jgi:hypothetical protein